MSAIDKTDIGKIYYSLFTILIYSTSLFTQAVCLTIPDCPDDLYTINYLLFIIYLGSLLKVAVFRDSRSS